MFNAWPPLRIAFAQILFGDGVRTAASRAKR